MGESDDEVRGRNDYEQNEDGQIDDHDDDEGNSQSQPIEVVTDVAVETNEHEPTQEDLEFEMAFEKMTSDSYQERMRDSIKPSGKIQDIPVPMMAKSGKKTYDQLHVSEIIEIVRIVHNNCFNCESFVPSYPICYF